METQTAPEEITFSLRIPVELNERIIADAKPERRSRQAHIVYLLEKLFEPRDGDGEKETKK